VNDKSTEKSITIAAFLLPLVVILRYPLFRGLDADEPISAWVTQGSFATLLHRGFEFQAQFPLYFILLWIWRALFGSAECAMRSLSIVFAAGTAICIFQIGKKYLEKPFQLLPLLILFSCDQFIIAAFSARPYSMALFFSTLSVLIFEKVLKDPSFKHLLLYGISLSLAWYTHYLFILIVSIHLAIWRADRKTAQLKWRQFLGSAVFAALISLPSLYHIAIWRSKQSMLSALAPASLKAFLVGIFPLQITTYIFISFAITAIMSSLSFKRGLMKKDLPLILWWVAAPILLLCLSLLLRAPLFTERYYLWQVPGIALALALLISLAVPEKSARNIIILYFLAALFLEVQRDWRIHDWRGAAAELSRHPSSEKVLVYTGLIEAEEPQWLNSPERIEYILAPFSVYPVQQKLTPISLAEQPPLNGEAKLVLVALRQLKVNLQPPEYAADIIAKRVEKHGYKIKESKQFGQVVVTEFLSE
jgi:hypothetical protein